MNDLNADGKSDLLWRSFNKGWNFLWTMDGTQTSAATPINVVQEYTWTMDGLGDYDGDGFQEVYWKTADSTAYLRALMHDDGNIQYANYQSESQMTEYLTTNGYSSNVSEIIS